jgi:hypothetical protein
MKIHYFFLYLWVIFALLVPDPDPATQINGSGSTTLVSDLLFTTVVGNGAKFDIIMEIQYCTLVGSPGDLTGNLSWLKSSVRRREWDRVFLIFMIRTMAASICINAGGY